MKSIHCLTGVIKKSEDKNKTFIYCIAETAEEAIESCKTFANDVEYVGVKPLGENWK